MKYLLDTMVWLWSVGPTDKIGRAGLEILTNGLEDVYLSAASSWEVAIKTRLGKFRLPEHPRSYVPKRLAEQGIRPLSITQSHSLKVYNPPLHHDHPFHRLIISQATAEDMTVLTSDRAFSTYSAHGLLC